MAVCQSYASPGTEIEVAFLEFGTESIESSYDAALAAPEILRLTLKAEADGYQAVVINCMADPGLDAARELVRIPVVGPAHPAMALAATLAGRFSVITISEEDRPAVYKQWRQFSLTERGASVRSVNIPVVDLAEDEDALLQAMVEQAILAVSQDGAEAIVFGCTGMGGQFANEVQRRLADAGYAGVPVIDPIGVAIRQAETLVALGISHSRLTYAPPPAKKRTGYESIRVYRDTAGE